MEIFNTPPSEAADSTSAKEKTELHNTFSDRLETTNFDARNINLWRINDDPSRLAREIKPREGQTAAELEVKSREGAALFAQMRDRYGIKVVSMEIVREMNPSGQEAVFTLVDKIDGQNLAELKTLPMEAKDELEALYVSLGQYYDDARQQKQKYWGDARSDQFVFGSKGEEKDAHFYLTDVDPEFYQAGDDEWHTLEAVLGSVSHDLIENEGKFQDGVKFQKAREKLLNVIGEMLKENVEQPMLVEAKRWLES